jgi:MFS family permease
MTAAPADRRAARRALLRNPDFRRLWLISAASEGVRALEIVITSVFVFRLTGSAFDVVVINFIRAMPLIALGPVAGVLASRFDRRQLLLWQVVAMAATTAILALLTAFDAIAVWHIALGGFLGGILFASDFSIRRTMLADVAGPGMVATAVGFDLATRSATRMLGPIAGGALFDVAGLEAGYVVGALLYLFCTFQTLALKTSFGALARATGGFFADLREGFGFIRRHRLVAGILTVTVVMNLTVFSSQTLVVVVGESVLGLSATAIGLLASAEGFGAMIGSMVMALAAPPRWYARLFLIGATTAALAVIGFSQSGSAVLSFVLLTAAGFGMACYATMQSTITLVASPPEMKSRVMGTLSICIGFSPVGILYLGQFAATLPPTDAILLSAGQGLVAIALVALLVPAFRRPFPPRPEG